MSAEWFAKKKDQLRLLGKHPVPNTKAKAVCETQVVIRSEKEKQLPATPKMKMMDRGRRMLMMSKADEAAEKFRKKSYGGKKGVDAATQEEGERREEVDVDTDIQEEGEMREEVDVDTATQEEKEMREEVDVDVATIENEDANETEVHGGQTKSWDEVVAEAGGLLVVSTGTLGTGDKVPDEVADEDGLVSDYAGEEDALEDNSDGQEENRVKRKKKTPLQYRTEAPKRMAEDIISSTNKKMFKEAWNTDKARFDKRQVKYNRPQNFLLILEDNIHEAGQEQSAKTAGKYMVYGRGAIKDNFLKDGIKYNALNFVMHANAHNFAVENVDDDQDVVQETRSVKKKNKKGKKTKKSKTVDDDLDEVQETRKVKKKNKKGKKSKGEYNMKSAATKVMCPGSYAEPGNAEEDGDDGDNGEEVDDVAEA